MKTYTGDYFEGILQLRHVTPELLSWVRNRIKSDNKARIAKEKKAKNGIDLYISDQHYLQNLGKKLSKQFKGILKISKRLHTVDKMSSRHLYRVTVLFEQIHFKRGQKIFLHGEEFEILEVNEKVRVKNVKTGKKSIVGIDRLFWPCNLEQS